MPGTATSEVEVTNISKHGFWILLDERELFLPFDQFPWFEQAPVGAILEVERPSAHHLYWPKIDVDLTEGEHWARVRATDGTGETQTDVRASPRPDGATGWHQVRFAAR